MQNFLDAAGFIAVYGISYGVILFTTSIGLVVMLSLMRVVNLAHGLFAAIGGYLTASLMSFYGLPFALSISAAVLMVALCSLVIERIFFVRLYQADELDQVLLTIGLMFIGIAALNAIFGPDIYPYQLPSWLTGIIDFAGRPIQLYRIFIIVFGIALITILWWIFDYTSFGARLRAAVDNRSMAEATGINVRRLFTITFALGTGLAALGGGVGIAIFPLEPSYPFKYLTLILIVVAMSGEGSIKNSALVAVSLGVIDTAARYVNPDWGGFVLYGVLIAYMIRRGSMPHRSSNSIIRGDLLRTAGFNPIILIYWACAIAIFFLFPDDLAFATLVLTMMIFVLSVDLVLGFAGVVTLGHAVFFGIGAYTAGLLSIWGLHEAVSGALLAGLVASLFAAMIGPVILRLSGLPQVMVTLVFGVALYDLANKASFITGGDDGLHGIVLDPLFGIFRWSVYGQTAFFYALGWLIATFTLIRLVISSPYGVALQGIRENSHRMRFIGTPVPRFLLGAFVLSGLVAGIAGAVSAQTTKFVGLRVFGIETSVDGLVMLVLGGVGRLYGALIGTPIYLFVHHQAAKASPYHWMFVIGLLLILVVLFARGGLFGLAYSIMGLRSHRAQAKE